VLQFLGDVNLFHGRFGLSAGAAPQDVSYVRPHELQVIAAPEEGAVAVTLSQALSVGPNTRLEFQRVGEEGYVDVEMSRAEYLAVRDQLGLKTGSRVYLRPRRVTRFSDTQPDIGAFI
jgi:sulfate transport system ATP-binding protein